MTQVLDILHLADKLDALGLHQEADALDKYLQKKAQLLDVNEKPFFTKIAQIMLALKKYRPSEVVAENITFPISKTSISGLTRDQVLEKVVDHIEVYIDKFMIPRLREKFANTPYQDSYRKFIEGARILATRINNITGGGGEKSRAREIVRLINQTQTMVSRLPIYAREHAKSMKDVEAIQGTQREIGSLLESLKGAVNVGDETQVKDIGAKLRTIFSDAPDIASLLFKSIVQSSDDAFDRGEHEKIKRATEDRLLEEEETWEEAATVGMTLESTIKSLKDKVERLHGELEEARALSKEYNEVVNELIQSQKELKAKPSPFTEEGVGKETIKKPPAPPTAIFRPLRYKSRAKMLQVSQEEVKILADWLYTYKEEGYPEKGVTFAQYIGKTPKEVSALLSVVEDNIKRIDRSVTYDLDRAITRQHEAEDQLEDYKRRISTVKNTVLWDAWRDKYIDRVLDVAEASLKAKKEPEVDTSQSLVNDALKGLRYLLGYEI